MRRAMRFLGRLVRCGKLLWRDERTPRWARWALGAAMLPTPFELDEVIRGTVALVLWLRHRELLRDVWAAAEVAR